MSKSFSTHLIQPLLYLLVFTLLGIGAVSLLDSEENIRQAQHQLQENTTTASLTSKQLNKGKVAFFSGAEKISEPDNSVKSMFFNSCTATFTNEGNQTGVLWRYEGGNDWDGPFGTIQQGNTLSQSVNTGEIWQIWNVADNTLFAQYVVDCDGNTDYIFTQNGDITPPEDICPEPVINVISGDFCSDNNEFVFATEDLGFPCLEYQWNFGTGATPATATGLGPITVNFSANSNYQVTLTATNNCENEAPPANPPVVFGCCNQDERGEHDHPHKLILEYVGNNTTNVVFRDNGGNFTFFSGQVSNGDIFVVDGTGHTDNHGELNRLDTDTEFSVGGGSFKDVHTSCSQDISPGYGIQSDGDLVQNGTSSNSVFIVRGVVMLDTGSGTSIYCEEGITDENGGGTICGDPCVDCEKTTTLDLTAETPIEITAEGCPIPQITCVPTSLCVGEAFVFTAVDLGYPCLEYQWNFGNNASPSTATGLGPITVTFNNGMNANVSLTATNNCENEAPPENPPVVFGCCNQDERGEHDHPHQLILEYVGGGTANVTFRGTEGDEFIFFSGQVSDGDIFVVDGTGHTDKHGEPNRLDTDTEFSIGGGSFEEVHTSCSQDISPGYGIQSNGDLVQNGTSSNSEFIVRGIVMLETGSGSDIYCEEGLTNDIGSPTVCGDVCIDCEESVNISIPLENCNTASIGDFVFEDTDGDGVQDPGEPGVPNVSVQLKNCQNTILATTMTDANGNYSFGDLPEGCYRIQIVLPNGFEPSPQDQGFMDALDSDINPASLMTGNINLAPGENNNTIDAGLTPVIENASVGNLVFKDTNGNGLLDVGEQGVPGVEVLLQTPQGVTVNQLFTNVGGFYNFTDVTPGDYKITFGTAPDCIRSPQTGNATSGIDNNNDANVTTGMTAVFTLNPGDNNNTIDAALMPAPVQNASVGNQVFKDTNGNGLLDAGEQGVSGVEVLLQTPGGNTVAQQTTNFQGFYNFTDVTPGDYKITFGTAPDCVRSVQTGDAFSGIDNNNDADVNTGMTAVFTLNPGDTNNTIDAALKPAPDLIDCDDINISVEQNDNNLIITNLDAAPIASVQIFNFAWTEQLFNCFADCGSSVEINVEPGMYRVYVKFYDSAYNFICQRVEIVTVNDDPCDNVTNGGTIGYNQTVCPGETAATLVGLTTPTGGSGAIEYQWLSSFTACPTSISQAIPGATGANYNPGVISQTTYFVRCSRRAGCTDWFSGESNCVVITADDSACEPVCDNVTNGGTIGYNQTLCPGETAATLVSLSTPTGGTGAIEYQWLSSKYGCPSSISQAISGATGATYNPGVIDQTTYYVRCSRRAGCTEWTVGESNCIKLTVSNVGCNDDPCADIDISVGADNGSISVAGLDGSPISSVQVFNSSWQTVFSCFGEDCNTPEQIINAQEGNYYVFVKLYSSSYQLICSVNETVSVSGEVCTAEAGTLTAIESTVTLTNGSAAIGAMEAGGLLIPQGYEKIFVLTEGPGLLIRDVNSDPAFTVTGTGDYTIHTLVYDPNTLDLGLVQIGTTTGFDVNNLLIQGGGSICGSLDVTGAPVQVVSVNDPCDNVTNGGMIGYNQTICPGESAAALINLQAPTGGSGIIEYQWLSSTTGCPTSISQAIPGATQPGYNPGIINQTTYFIRCARRAGCTDWVTGESNCVIITVDDTDCDDDNGSSVDLAIEITGSGVPVNAYQSFSVQLQVINEGGQTATGVVINIPQPANVVFQGGNAYSATQGTYNPFSGFNWEVGTLGAGQTAVITLNYFSLAGAPYVVYGQVQAMNETDNDSTPGNGNGVTPLEDDEAVYSTDGDNDNEDPSCTLNLVAEASNIQCNDNGTPFNSGDDTFTFDLTVTGGNPWGWYAGGQSGQYDVPVSFGPYSIAAGAVNLTVTDTDNTSCTTQISVSPPATCSSGEEPNDGCDNVQITPGNGSITVSGLENAPLSALWVFDAAWNLVYSCSYECNTSETVSLPAGSYHIRVKKLNHDWSVICEVEDYITVASLYGGNTGSNFGTGNTGMTSFNGNSSAENDFKVYPNPTYNTVRFLPLGGNLQNVIRYEVYDYSGGIITRADNLNQDILSLSIDLSEKQRGVYLLRVYFEDGNAVSKEILLLN